MNRRRATLGLCVLVLVVLGGVAWLQPVPYVTFSPGPTADTLGRVDNRPVVAIEGRRVYPTEGSLLLTTVSVTDPGREISLPEALGAWFDPERALVPREVVYPDDERVKEVEEESTQQFQVSQETAIVAALGELGIRVDLPLTVMSIAEGAPASGHLEVGDVILSVDGERVRRTEEVVSRVRRVEPGTPVRFTVERGTRRLTVSSPTRENPTEPGAAMVGITVGPRYDLDDLPFTVSIDVEADIGGPSAGLVFALAIVDKLTPGALTSGNDVAGTGVITPDGQVEAISGIQQKIVAAREQGAEMFLVPAGNCAEALAAGNDGGEVVLAEVRSLHGAIGVLRSLRAGQDTDVQTCGGGTA